MTTPSRFVRHDDERLLNDALISCIRANMQPATAQIQQQADELVMAWFQDSVKADYTVVDHRAVILDYEPHAGHSDFAGLCMFKTGISYTGNRLPLPLPKLPDFPPAQDRYDQRFQGWHKQIGPKSDMMSSTYEVTAPHPAVIAAVYLYSVTPDRRSVLALFELKPTSGQG